MGSARSDRKKPGCKQGAAPPTFPAAPAASSGKSRLSGAPLLKKRLHIRSRQGLHARPAALFVQVANRFASKIRVRKGRSEVDGKSIMGLLTLAASKGSTLEVTLEGPDAEDALRALEQLVSRSDPPAVVTVVRHPAPHGPSPDQP